MQICKRIRSENWLTVDPLLIVKLVTSNMESFWLSGFQNNFKGKVKAICKPPLNDAYEAFKNMLKAIRRKRELRAILKWVFKPGTYFLTVMLKHCLRQCCQAKMKHLEKLMKLNVLSISQKTYDQLVTNFKSMKK